jgi:hypothetical protein
VTARKTPKAIVRKPARKPARSTAASSAAADEARIMSSNLTLHELFQQQTTIMLDRADLSEEQKQSILIGMSCPCCGGGGFSFTAKLKR